MRMPHRHIASLLFFSLFSASVLWAQPLPALDAPPTEVQLRIQLDDLMETWPVASARARREAPRDIEAIPAWPSDEILAQRVQELGGSLKFQLDQRVRHYIQVFVKDRREETEALLGMMQVHLPGIRNALRERQLPSQLQYLPVVLSACNPLAVGSGNKSGIWQLPYHAALRQGLSVDAIQDERRDPELSTGAALAHLSGLYQLYGDWALTITAYASGPGAITKARLRRNPKAGYPDLYPFLEVAGREYWPAFVAMNYVGTFHRQHGLTPLPVSIPPQNVTAKVDQVIQLSAVSEVLHISKRELQSLNPLLRGDAVCLPGESGMICIPRTKLEAFEAKKTELYARGTVLTESAEAEVEERPEAEVFTPPANRTLVKYTIQPGDNLGAIASQHGVRVSELQQWNSIRGTMIKAGEKLDIYVKKGAVVNQNPAPSKKESPKSQTYKSYTVRSGDTLWGIAQKYPGISPEAIMEANDIGEDIRPGQVIKIPVK